MKDYVVTATYLDYCFCSTLTYKQKYMYVHMSDVATLIYVQFLSTLSIV